MSHTKTALAAGIVSAFSLSFAVVGCSTTAQPSDGITGTAGDLSASWGKDAGASMDAATSNACPPSTLPPVNCALGDVASIVIALNQGEIDEAQAALSRAQNQQTLAFAQKMVTDHTALLDAAEALFAQLGITATSNDLAAQITAQSAGEVQSYAVSTSTSFDRTYLADQILDHIAALGVLQQLVIPSAASSPQLQSAIASAVTVVEGHLAMAVAAQTALGGACGSGVAVVDAGAPGDAGMCADGGSSTATDAAPPVVDLGSPSSTDAGCLPDGAMTDASY